MPGEAKRSRLEALSAALRQLDPQVPPRARRFHERVGHVLKRADELARSRFAWGGDQQIEQLESEATLLSKLAPALAQLCEEAASLSEKVARLARRERELGGELAAWLRARCRTWTAALERLGSEVDRPAEIDQDRGRWEGLARAVGLADQATDLLLEARRALAALGNDPRGAALAAALPGLEDRLKATGGDSAWLAELGSKLQPLREQPLPPQQPPAELGTVSATLQEARGWYRALDEPPVEAQILEERYRFFAEHWRSAEPRELSRLVTEAERLRDELRERASRRRNARFQELEDLLRDLTEACGSQPELRERMAALRGRRVDHYNFHKDWLQEADQVHERLRAVAGNHELELEKRLQAQLGRLGEGLSALREVALSETLRARVDLVANELGTLGRVSGVDAILPALGRLPALRIELEALGTEARREQDELAAELTEAETRLRRLCDAAEAAGLPVPEMEPLLDRQGSRAMSLEAARERVQARLAEIAVLELRFAEACRRQLAEESGAAGRAHRALSRADRPRPSARSVPPATNDPEDWSRTVLEARNLREAAFAQVAAATARLEARCEEAETELSALEPALLAPADRESRERIVQELREGSYRDTPDPLEQLTRLSQVVAKAELFRARLVREQEELRSRREELRRRLQELGAENLMQHLAGHFARVSALVYGIPDEPASWRRFEPQIRQAEELLERLAPRARRIEAQRVEAAVSRLEAAHQSGATPRPKQGRGLLAELSRAGHEELPPVNLRLRLWNAVPGLRGEEER